MQASFNDLLEMERIVNWSNENVGQMMHFDGKWYATVLPNKVYYADTMLEAMALARNEFLLEVTPKQSRGQAVRRR